MVWIASVWIELTFFRVDTCFQNVSADFHEIESFIIYELVTSVYLTNHM